MVNAACCRGLTDSPSAESVLMVFVRCVQLISTPRGADLVCCATRLRGACNDNLVDFRDLTLLCGRPSLLSLGVRRVGTARRQILQGLFRGDGAGSQVGRAD